MRRSIAPAGANAIWAARFMEYRIERWSLDGALEETLVRTPAWFEARSHNPPFEEVDSILPHLYQIHETSDSLLIVFIRVAAIGWRDRARMGATADGPALIVEGDVFDTIIDVIDLRTKTLLLSQRVDPVLGVLQDGRVYAYREADDGAPTIEIWSMTIRRRPSGATRPSG